MVVSQAADGVDSEEGSAVVVIGEASEAEAEAVVVSEVEVEATLHPEAASATEVIARPRTMSHKRLT